MNDHELYSTVVVRQATTPIRLGDELLGGKICAASVGNLVEANIALEAECEKLAETKEQSETRWAGYVRESNLRREIEAERDALAAELAAIKGQEPDCDRSACGDFSPGRCDNPDCSARRDRKPALPAAPEGGEV